MGRLNGLGRADRAAAQQVQRAVLGDPEALARRLCQEILRLHAELAFTLVYVTHSSDEAREIGMRIVELDRSSVP